MESTRFMTAKEKGLVLKAWKRFLAKGLRWEDFIERLYSHLINNCSFIAHYDRGGFYAEYFESGDQIILFLRQFDARNAGANGIPPSVEYDSTEWIDDDYGDLNRAMIEAATPYIDSLFRKAQEAQRAEDIQEAERLLAKHGIALGEICSSRRNNDGD